MPLCGLLVKGEIFSSRRTKMLADSIRLKGKKFAMLLGQLPKPDGVSTSLRRLFTGSLLPPISFYLWDRAASINRRGRFIWPLILTFDSTQEADCSYSPLRHVGHFDPVLLSQFFQTPRNNTSSSSCAHRQSYRGPLSFHLTGTAPLQIVRRRIILHLRWLL